MEMLQLNSLHNHHTQTKCLLKKMKDRKVKQVLPRDEYQWVGEGIRKG
jgi:hypothetical protein